MRKVRKGSLLTIRDKHLKIYLHWGHLIYQIKKWKVYKKKRKIKSNDRFSCVGIQRFDRYKIRRKKIAYRLIVVCVV